MEKIRAFLITMVIVTISIPCLSQQDTSQILISRLEVQGHHQVPKKEFEKIIPRGRYSNEQLKSALFRVLKLYQQKGFYFTQVDSRVNIDHLLLSINEGAELKIDNFDITAGDSLMQKQMASLLDLRQKLSATETINFNVEQILKYLENHGYPFCQVSIDSIITNSENDSTTAQVICYLGLQAGPYVTIDSIIVQGTSLTRRQVVVRETRLKPGVNYHHEKVERVPERLMRTGLFNQVDVPEIFLDAQGRGCLIVKIKESNPNQLNAVLGYNPASNKHEQGFLTGLIDVAFKNLLGTGRTIEAFWQKKDRRSQELRFHYIEPWVAGYPIDLGMEFQQTIQDTTFLRRNLMLEIEVPFSDLVSVYTNFGKEDVLPDSIGQILYGLPRSQSWFSRLGLTYDTRDNFGNPIRGLRYHTQFEYARKNVSAASSTNEDLVQRGNFRRDRWLVDFELYIPTWRWQTILWGLYGRQVRTNENYISMIDLFRFGGTTSLRGYREEEFRGERIAWTNCEYRYLLGSKSRVFLFCDGGYFYQKNREGKIIKGYKVGYGFGVRVETRLGIIGIDYGLGKGRGITSGLVHVGLMNQF